MKSQTALNDFLQSCLAQDLSPMTIQWYRQKLLSFTSSCSELPKDARPIDAFLAALNFSRDTKANYLKALRAFFRFTSERYDIGNPMVKVHRLSSRDNDEQPMPTLEPDEEMKLLLSSSSSLRDRALLTLFIDTGMRTGEAIGLRPCDIKAETVEVQGKSGKREVPISEETRLLLLSVSQGSEDGYVFHGHKGHLTRCGVYRIVATHMKKAGIKGPKLGAHRIRHAFGKGYLVNGGDLRSLQKIMGHKKITTTQKYLALSISDVVAKHHKFTPLKASLAAASFFDTGQAVKEAEAILKEANHGN